MCHPYLVHGWSLVQSSQLAGAGVLTSLLLIKLHDCSFWTVPACDSCASGLSTWFCWPTATAYPDTGGGGVTGGDFDISPLLVSWFSNEFVIGTELQKKNKVNLNNFLETIYSVCAKRD